MALHAGASLFVQPVLREGAMTQRMIFFPQRRRVNGKALAVSVFLLTLSALSFVAGLKAGVEYSSSLSANVPFLSVQTASAEL